MRDHPIQSRLYHASRAVRFRVVPAGRRSGKTELAKRYVAQEAMANAGHRYFIAGPTRPQIEAIYWEDMKALLDGHIRKKSETKLCIWLDNGSFIQLFGLGGTSKGSGTGARIEGTPWHGGIIDEYANCPPESFDHNIMPALSEFGGWCWFIGVPEGRNHYYEFYMRGLDDSRPEWGSFTWKSSDIISPAEVELAKRDMDPRMYRQEYEGAFESFAGMLYYSWDHRYIAPVVLNPFQPLWLSADFNKSPMIWNIYQVEQRQMRDCLNVLDEINIPINAKTTQAAHEFVRRYKNHPIKTVYLTGDSSGNHESWRDWSTDYVIIKSVLKEAGFDIVWRVPKGNPSINNRVNIACSLFFHGRVLVHPKCIRLIYDLDRNESDGKGAKNKEDKMQTHASDNFDYVIWQIFSAAFYGKTVKRL